MFFCIKFMGGIISNITVYSQFVVFETKIGECPGLEIADLISYLTYLDLENKLNTFDSRDLPKLWRVVKSKMQGKKPQQIKGKKLAHSLSRNRVHKISKFVRITKGI